LPPIPIMAAGATNAGQNAGQSGKARGPCFTWLRTGDPDVSVVADDLDLIHINY